jgi:hypothetical protein
MTRIALDTRKTPWECKWSRPGFRLAGLHESLQPESVWVCVRRKARRRLSDTTCDDCPFWQPDEFRKN